MFPASLRLLVVAAGLGLVPLGAAAAAAQQQQPAPAETTPAETAPVETAPATSPSPAAPEAPAKAEESEPVCRYVKLDPASRRKTKVCRTLEEWRQLNLSS